MMLEADLQKPSVIDAWIIDSAACMGKDVEADFASDAFDISVNSNGTT